MTKNGTVKTLLHVRTNVVFRESFYILCIQNNMMQPHTIIAIY